MSSNFNCSCMARSSLTYIPFLAHLAFRPCELLPSLFIRRPSVNISHFNLLRNHWANCNQTLVEWSMGGPLANCVRWSRLPTKMTTKLKIEKRGMKLKKNLLLWNYWANLDQTLLKWSLGGPLPKLCRHFRPPTKMAATAELNLT
jgi:hypothetical protein